MEKRSTRRAHYPQAQVRFLPPLPKTGVAGCREEPVLGYHDSDCLLLFFQPPRGDALSTLAEELRCRLCDYLYSDEEGCETCVPAKRTIVWPSDVTAGRSAEVVGWEVVKVLRRHLERIRKEERDLKHRGLSPQLVDAAVKIGNALTKLIAELRKMEDREREDVRNMSDEKKLRLMLDHVANLPRAVREQFLTEAVRMLQTGIEVLPSGRDRLPAAEPKE